ncbi:Uncharacterised protein [Actinomyces bovis]|uniref:Uncharacterized protein n=1 Tax=Actinomyces bovis TaxID=1658 RepID=A0ABY1VQS8_9ACTO|nr:hypothetical protein [Actinomyces bovis]SPT55028.1 Uncharacterised protein [Actinomyces bovis]VEG56176.1 Uncharacterised protein [Actinomyces israelii]
MILTGTTSSALTTFGGLGLGLILEGAGASRVRVGWTDSLEPQLVVSAAGYDDDAVAAAVLQHAQSNAQADSWIQANLDSAPWGGQRAVFSPRIKKAEKTEQWMYLQKARHDGIDRLRALGGFGTELELIGALGEPAYWPVRMNEIKPDEGASRWEMKTRNRGEEFVGNRLRQLTAIVSKRSVEQVRDGLTGVSVVDEAYKGKRSDESRTSTGLTGPRFTDSALAWCALWGISCFPVLHQLGKASVTAAALPVGKYTPEYLVLPLLVGGHSLARWRSVLVSGQLHDCVGSSGVACAEAERWLLDHGVWALAVHPVMLGGSANAPERSLGECLEPKVLVVDGGQERWN